MRAPFSFPLLTLAVVAVTGAPFSINNARAAEPTCKKVFSVALTGKADRPTSRTRYGSCAAAREEESERQLNQAKIECLMNGYEDALELKVSCTQAVARTAEGKRFQLHFDFSWRCSKMLCE
jgi:hypothetical protein